MRIVYRPAAEVDLLDIYLSIAVDDPDAADRQIDRIKASLQRLRDFPRSGSLRPDIDPSARGITVGHYAALYRVTDKEVEIVRVIHTARDMKNLAVDFERKV